MTSNTIEICVSGSVSIVVSPRHQTIGLIMIKDPPPPAAGSDCPHCHEPLWNGEAFICLTDYTGRVIRWYHTACLDELKKRQLS